MSVNRHAIKICDSATFPAVRYDLARTGRVRIAVFDVLGEQVAVLVHEMQNAGVHRLRFDASNLTSGIYFYRIHVGSFSRTNENGLHGITKSQLQGETPHTA